jgi:hypothetical protein
MQALIERLKSATDETLLLNSDIADAVKLPLRHYTGSLDAAVTLVPEGWAWFVQWIGEPFTEGCADLWIPTQRTKGLKVERVRIEAKTPAIALCAAALEARIASLAQTGDGRDA